VVLTGRAKLKVHARRTSKTRLVAVFRRKTFATTPTAKRRGKGGR